MSIYQLVRRQEITAGIEQVWDFISSPGNLKKITPDYMGFDITNGTPPEKMYPGLIIEYKVSPLLGIKTTWVTEITHVKEMEYFVDEQRVGPYKMWHHEHHIETAHGGVLMTDIVSYLPPFGFLGKIANRIIIRRKLEDIFSFRTVALEKIFGRR